MRRPVNTSELPLTTSSSFPLPQPHKSALRTSSSRPTRLTWRRALCILISGMFFVTSHALMTSFHAAAPPLQDSIILSKPKIETPLHHATTKTTKQQPPPPRHDPNAPPTPILVFGSHHTGTSIITKLVLEMGAYGGDPNKDLLMLQGNPLKYNEYSLAVEADKRVMVSGTPPTPHGPWWVNYGFTWERVPPQEQEHFKSTIRTITSRLADEAKQHGKSAWVIKDPRMTLLATHWLEAAGKDAICLIVTREPLQTSRRLAKKYNDGKDQSLTVSEWTRFWEEAMVRTIEACVGGKHPIVFAPHKILATSPAALADSLALRLSLHPISPESVVKLLGGASDFASRAHVDDQDALPTVRDVSETLSPRASMIWRLLDSQDLVDISLAHLKGYSWTGTPSLVNSYTVPSAKGKIKYKPGKKAKEAGATPAPTLGEDELGGKEETPSSTDVAFDARKQFTPKSTTCYATIVTGNARGFVAGALALAVSIRTFDTARDMVAMISAEVDDEDVIQSLTLAGWIVVRVPKLAEPWFGVGPCTHFTPGQVVRWGRMFSKLRVYSLPYERILYLDTDTMVLRDPRVYFDLPGEFYAERSPSHEGFNAGIMLVRPNEMTLKRLIDYAVKNPPMVFWTANQVGCTEQELLNRFYNGKDMKVKLNNTRHFDYMSKSFTDLAGREENKLHGARIAHSLTVKCDKAWDVRLREFVKTDSEFKHQRVTGYCDPEMYVQWYRYWQSPSIVQAKELLWRKADTADAGGIPAGLQIGAIPEGGLNWVLDTVNMQEMEEEKKSQVTDTEWKVKNWRLGGRNKK